MTFRGFFSELWGHSPFPWQEDLAARVMKGQWRRIGLPTASGKTAAIDIAVYALAMGAPGAARRIFFVVDRRVIVDEAAQRAAEIAKKLLDAPDDSALGEVARRLRALGGNVPLDTAVLRGGIARDDSWADSPLQPIVVCSTVDQIGSSLMFRAYGTSEYARPIRAGLAACDSLILLDEAHTSGAFAETLRAIQRYRAWADSPIDLPFTVVEMSATPSREALAESEKDLENEVLKRRWKARKRARLVTADGDDTAFAAKLADEACTLRARGANVIGVIANRVRTARLAYDALAGAEGCDAILLTGRSRPYDRDRIWKHWKDRIGLGRKRDEATPVYVVATQCIEVGANLDFDGLVTEIASIDALEQRFGRLDRDGVQGESHAAIVARKEQTQKKYQDRLYGGAIAATWGWLAGRVVKQGRGRAREQFVEMGVTTLREALKSTENRGALTTPAQPSPVLMPAHMDLLCQTSPEPEISPEVSVYLHGPESGSPDVHIVWRADLDENDPNTWADSVAICPPAAAEMMPVPLYAAKQWLSRRKPDDVADVEGAEEIIDRTGGGMQPVLCWRGVDESEPLYAPEKLRAGMTIVVPSAFGGCDDWGWKPELKKPVPDIGDAVKLAMGRPMLRLHPKVAKQWGYEELAASLRKMEDPELGDFVGQEWTRDAVRALQASKRLKWIDDPQEPDQWRAVVSQTVFDQNDVRSAYGAPVPLGGHLSNCAAVAAEFAAGLPDRLRRTIVRAVEAHDIGKADPRFQAWLRGGNPVGTEELLAKSARNGQNRAAIERARVLAGYPKGGRHELMSTALLLARGEAMEDVDRELLLHLIASHHGRCRPFAPVVPDDNPVMVEYEGVMASSAHGLERVGSGISERFWRLTRRYGWYGLAYLEAVVRLTDQRQSEREQSGTGRAAHA